MDLQQGICIRLEPGRIDDPSIEAAVASGGAGHGGGSKAALSEQLYQVIGVDQNGGRCWLRRWPLARHGSPVFEISLQQLQEHQPHRPLPAGRYEG
jgi:hypothetical protein